jgi:hypothetical protein
MTGTITPEMRESARKIGEAYIAFRMTASTAAMDAFRAANRESRALHGEDVHNIVKGLALAGVDSRA